MRWDVGRRVWAEARQAGFAFEEFVVTVVREGETYRVNVIS